MYAFKFYLVPKVKIRAAELQDIDEIIEVCVRSIRISCVQDHDNDKNIIAGWLKNKTPENVANWIRSLEHALVVAESDNSVIGAAMVSRAGYISLVYVHPLHQNRGVGKSLMKAMETFVSDSGGRETALKSTSSALGFYKKIGYSVEGEADDFLDMTVYPMTKIISVSD